jgi:hypothetical protein
MKVARRPGAFVAFIDSYTEETILKIESDLNGVHMVSYHLYDRCGELVSDSDGPQAFPEGLEISTGEGEILLHLPSERSESISYRLYSPRGVLMTCSDGSRTQIFGSLRIDGNKHLSGRPPDATRAAAARN